VYIIRAMREIPHLTDGNGKTRTKKEIQTMTQTTENIIKTVLEGDATTTPEQAKAVFAILKGQNETQTLENADKILSRKEVAAILGKSEKSVDIYGRRGIIRRVNLMGGKQAQGYSGKSVYEAIKRGTLTK